MHMNDALVSPSIAGVATVISLTFIAVAVKKIKQSGQENIIPLMGVMGAFVFVAQMINFAIPGTGSSGHIVGAVLLSVILGPWAAFLVLSSVLIIQCLIFADGGLMALGCNILNMGILSCFVAYPLLFRPFIQPSSPLWKVILFSIITCVIGFELGALAITIETTLSGITALPMGKFMLFMLPIHLVIGVCEGVLTAAVLCFIKQYSPEILQHNISPILGHKKSSTLVILLASTLLLGTVAGLIASSLPDGLEWSILQLAGDTPIIDNRFLGIQQTTAILSDYEHSLSGIIGAIMVVVLIYMVSLLFRHKLK